LTKACGFLFVTLLSPDQLTGATSMERRPPCGYRERPSLVAVTVKNMQVAEVDELTCYPLFFLRLVLSYDSLRRNSV